MIKTNKKTCINLSTDSYTGKEQSPKGFGYSADAYELNYEKTGQDNRIWLVQIKNNRKVWTRKNCNISNITHEEPILNENSDNNDNSNEKTQEVSNDIINENQKEKNEDKNKKTDYNIFLKYYLDLLKNINETKSNSDKKTNKELFAETVSEWKNIKKLITDKKNNNKEIINDFISKWNSIKIVPSELIEILQK